MIGSAEVVSAPVSTQSGAVPAGPVRRAAWVLAGTVSLAAAIAPLFALHLELPPSTLSLLAAVVLGMSAGLLTRWVISPSRRVLQYAASAASVAAAHASLAWVTEGLAGSRAGEHAAPDWGGFILLCSGIAVGWLALRAWERPARSPGLAVATRPRPPAAPGPRGRERRPPAPLVQRPSSGPPRVPRAQSHPAASERPPRAWLPPRLLRLPRLGTWPSRPLGGGRRRRVAVKLVGEIEHRCPYCLDRVERRDPRGVVVCPECKTHHHADCWAVTGMCQVPHRQPL